MGKRKVVYICDVNNTVAFMNSPEVKEMLDPLWEQYDVDFEAVQDQENMGMSFTEFAEKFEKNGPEWYLPPEKVLRAVADAEIIMCNYVLVPKVLIDAAKNCKLILTTRGGVENVNVDYATKKGIQVANSPFANNFSVPDFAVALMLAASRNIVKAEIGVNHGAWKHEENSRCRSMRSLKIGLLGFGAIARNVAHKLSGFGTTVLVADPFVPDQAVLDAGCVPLSTEELLKQADIVSLHVRLLPATAKMFKAEYFELMKPTAWLVNTARAGLIDTPALLEALQKRKIAGAALDVFDKEPLPADSPFFALDNVILEPHISGSSCDTKLARIKCFLDDFENYLKTGEIAAKVNFR